MIIGKINDKVLIDDLVFREEEHKRIMYVNEMEDYLYNHNYISKNKDKDPFRQQELSVERASCIVQKYRTLTEEKDKEIERLKAREQECIDKYLAESKYRSKIEGKYVVDEYIINELEKWLEESAIYEPYLYNGILNKLKELKELKEGK